MANQDYLNKYAACMEEIKMRTEVIRAFFDGRCSALYKQTTAESIGLQIRKILELIALASLVANKDEYARNRAKFASDWHAKRILSDIEAINPLFYPVPTEQVHDESGENVVETKLVSSGYLTKAEFEKLYDKCGSILHAQNPFSATKDIDRFIKDVPEWMKKIMKLLNHHQIQLVQSDLQFWVLMQSKKDGKVQVTLFQQVP